MVIFQTSLKPLYPFGPLGAVGVIFSRTQWLPDEKLMTLMDQVNRSLPAMDESCACESESWKCGSVSGNPPNLLLSTENTTDEVSVSLLHFSSSCTLALDCIFYATCSIHENETHTNEMHIAQHIRAYFVYQVFQLPQSVSPTSWILDTHYAFLEQRSSMRAIYEPGTKSFRYGGWREGLEGNSSVPANSENSAVYFNNKVCKMIVIFVEQNV